MTEHDVDFEAVFSELKKSSNASLAMVVLGALCLVGSLIYSATRLTPLENDVAQKKVEIERLAGVEKEYQQKIEAAKVEYESLKTNIEAQYAVKVTSENAVYELKASAIVAGKQTSGAPLYDFTIFINSGEETLQNIKQATYHFNHPTFRKPVQVVSDPKARFEVSYRGWGCLTAVHVEVEQVSGSVDEFDFDMCKSLGPDWGNQLGKPPAK
jgi:hypothetical protein